ncbi:MAG TPA: universal stress protein [Kofleriaceae bacterium]|nr:universal stress protein [Kofleriaceae bacterium]
MLMQRILVPVDFSAASEAGARAAAVIAARHRAALALLHVVPQANTAVNVVEPVYVPPELAERVNTGRFDEADRKMADLAGQLREQIASTVDVTTEIVGGDAVDEILAAADRGADLLVIGSSGLSGIARLVLGSVAESVSRLAACPVLVVHDRESEEAVDYRRIMVGVDFSPVSEGICRLAAAIAGPGGHVDVVHVWEPPELSTLTVDLGDLAGSAGEVHRAAADQRAAVARRLARFVDDLQIVGAHLTSHVALGSPVPELLQRAADTRPDVVALGSHAREGITERLLGTVADRVLRGAGRPVLLLPRPARGRWTKRP